MNFANAYILVTDRGYLQDLKLSYNNMCLQEIFICTQHTETIKNCCILMGDDFVSCTKLKLKPCYSCKYQ